MHLNELSLICDMWVNKITYLLMGRQNDNYANVENNPNICTVQNKNIGIIKPISICTAIYMRVFHSINIRYDHALSFVQRAL